MLHLTLKCITFHIGLSTTWFARVTLITRIWAELPGMTTTNNDALPPSSKRAKPLNISEQLLEIEYRFCEELRKINFGSSVAYVYNPLEYASEPHGDFVHKYGNGKKKILFLGMNPGPFGMAQNGVRCTSVV